MITLVYAPGFIRKFKKLDTGLQDEIIEKLGLFKNEANHEKLKVHKLKGVLKNCHSFSVNYKFRVVFSYGSKNDVHILSVGNHEIYE
ncbi:hypothetical protein A3A21_01250 [Candidatus Jorgensenbacteria bacterium RIFCSPLOWO2_01_FULL_45_25b]|uniref:Plasmid stabilization protein n=1 Tax=Candidatus Jorgensenbacteria bacterium RIFCSPLOWO2_01_FULL_45_25b TaxID=1798471 RepID=A0A1F6BVK1_9BACT|nr:MAG: hypothetical protein A3A21_01250 [Candidatus Jorgensenbacteria bacterium RIFCSPLOWO2_01_FULL_45_25b]